MACISFVKEFEKMKYRDLKKKSRVRWASDGDENSKYFHGIINSNLSNNRLHGFLVNGLWVSNPIIMKDMVFDFFAKKFEEPMRNRPSLVSNNLKKLSEVEANGLIVPFRVEEIKDVVWECAGDRSPGPDGYNFKFLKRFWSCFQGNFVKILYEFFVSDSFSFGSFLPS
ncbi:uncharacterized protein LOC143621966 [Bidens hawaiensis]|uniref:uncharacterized protein LOC143621966 n=1 Tax=Bidens hawaiensis TaxID=980011 RepID=UPI00404A5388